MLWLFERQADFRSADLKHPCGTSFLYLQIHVNITLALYHFKRFSKNEMFIERYFQYFRSTSTEVLMVLEMLKMMSTNSG